MNVAAKMNGWGAPLRIVTPIMTFLITVLVSILLTNVTTVKSDVKEFQHTLAGLDKRVTVIESNRFTSGDAQSMMESVFNKLPPKWLLEQVRDNKERINSIERKQ